MNQCRSCNYRSSFPSYDKWWCENFESQHRGELMNGDSSCDCFTSEKPRICTLNEVLKNGDKLMWLQYKSVNTPEHYELYPTSPYDDNRPDSFSVSFQSGHVMAKGLYGRQWRCWTDKPSVADAMDW